MAPGRARDERKEQQWRRWIDRWQDSGLSVPAFCARHGLSPGNFYAWRRTLQRRATPQAPFVPVQLVADAAPAAALEVVLADGRAVRVAPGFDAATLRQLLAVLREDPPC
jgi:transposase-like protein